MSSSPTSVQASSDVTEESLPTSQAATEAEAVLVSGYGEAAVLLDPHSGHAIANERAERVQRLFNGQMHPDLLQVVEDAAVSGKVMTISLTQPTESGQVVYRVNVVPNVLGGQVLLLFHDQTLDSNLRDALIESRQRFKDLVEISSDFSWEVGPDGTFAFVSRPGVLGYASEDMIGRNPEDLIVGAEEFDPVPFLSRKRVEDIELWMHRADGQLACVTVSALPFFEDDGTCAGVRGVCHDVTHEREKASALAHAQQREQVLSYIVGTIRDEIDPANMLSAAAAATARAMGASGCRVLRTDLGDEDGAVLEFETAAEFGRGGPEQFGTDFLTFGKGELWLREAEMEGWQVIAAPCLHGGEVNGVICLWKHSDWNDDDRLLVNDISNQLGIAIEQIENHESILHLSRTDPMTGLLNRRAFFDEELPRYFKRMEHDGISGALFYVDMDNFKMVNDVHGHQTGDEAITTLRNLLHDFVRPGDLIARLGGDEFALWLDGISEEVALTRSQDLLRLSQALQIYSGAPDKPLGISIGIAVYQPGSCEPLASLVARADAAMYDVKQSSKGDCCLASPYGGDE